MDYSLQIVTGVALSRQRWKLTQQLLLALVMDSDSLICFMEQKWNSLEWFHWKGFLEAYAGLCSETDTVVVSGITTNGWN